MTLTREWLDENVHNLQHVYLNLECPFCGNKAHVSCECGNDVFCVERKDWSRQFNSMFSFPCALDGNIITWFATDPDKNDFERAKLTCPNCAKEVLAARFCEISDAKDVDPSDRIREIKELQKNREQAAALQKKQEQERADKLRMEKALSGRDNAIVLLTDLIRAPVLILDSNIWMNPGYDSFFSALGDLLRQKSGILIIYGPQFDEICNVKRKSPYGSNQNRSARCSLNRIELLQSAGLLQIEPLTIDADVGVYADPLIVKLIVKHTSQGTAVSFVSDDMELRIRVRGLAGKGPGTLSIIQGRDFLPLCQNYCIAGGLSFKDIDVDKYYSQFSNDDAEVEKTNDTDGYDSGDNDDDSQQK